MKLAVAACIPFLFCVLLATGTASPADESLPDMGPAPDFNLLTASGEQVHLRGLRNQVVVVSFFYTWCPDICPLHTDKMSLVRDQLGDAFGRQVTFVSITFDPVRDPPEVLLDYADAFDANVDGWFFLTGNPDEIRQVATHFGIVTLQGQNGFIDHNLITTIVDKSGRMRVQYAGYKFDPAHMHADLQKLIEQL